MVNAMIKHKLKPWPQYFICSNIPEQNNDFVATTQTHWSKEHEMSKECVRQRERGIEKESSVEKAHADAKMIEAILHIRCN